MPPSAGVTPTPVQRAGSIVWQQFSDASPPLVLFVLALDRPRRYPGENALLGRNVSVIMPPPYNAQHNSYLKRYAATGKASVLGTRQVLEGKHKKGHTFPIALTVNTMEVEGQAAFMGARQTLSIPPS